MTALDQLIIEKTKEAEKKLQEYKKACSELRFMQEINQNRQDRSVKNEKE